MNPWMLSGSSVGIILTFAVVVAAIGTLSSAVFLGMALVASVRYRKIAEKAKEQALAVPTESLPAVAILKPIHGMEEQLEKNLESFFEQDYPDYEVIFGAREADNPALAVAERVRSRFPHVKSHVILSGPPTWPNAKVFSLEKMIKATGRSYFVISDS